MSCPNYFIGQLMLCRDIAMYKKTRSSARCRGTTKYMKNPNWKIVIYLLTVIDAATPI